MIWSRPITRLLILGVVAVLPLAGDISELDTKTRAFIEIHFLAAKRAEAAGDFERAANEYEAIVKKHPKVLPEVYQNLGIVYYLARKYDLAIDRFTQGMQLNPKMEGTRLLLGASYIAIGQPEKALPHLELAQREKPSPESTTYLGLAHMGLKRYELAARHLCSALAGSDQRDNLLYFIGENYLKASEQVSNILAEDNPDSRYDHLITARILDSQDYYQLAAKAYLDAGKKDPFHAVIFYYLARALAILGEEGPSELSMDRYRKLAPADSNAKLDTAKLPKKQIAAVGLKVDYGAELRALPPVPARGPVVPLLNSDVNALLRKKLSSPQSDKWKAATDHLVHGRWSEGLAALESLRPRPSDWVRDYLVASVYLWTEKHERAEEVLRRPSVAKQTAQPLQMLRWEVYQQLAFEYFNRLLEEHPNSARAHYLKARALDAQGKREALEEYQLAIQADPGVSELRVALADYYLSNSKFVEALAECERALELDPWAAAAKKRIGRIYVQLRQAEKGVPYLQEGLQGDLEDAQSHTDLARGYELMGQTDKAIAEYQLALRIDPSLNRIHYVLARIYRSLGKTDLADREYQLFEQNEAIERQKHRERLRQVRGVQELREEP